MIFLSTEWLGSISERILPWVDVFDQKIGRERNHKRSSLPGKQKRNGRASHKATISWMFGGGNENCHEK